jgi:hypothetical protein
MNKRAQAYREQRKPPKVTLLCRRHRRRAVGRTAGLFEKAQGVRAQSRL